MVFRTAPGPSKSDPFVAIRRAVCPSTTGIQIPRFNGLYRAWIWQGESVLEQARSPALAAALASGGRIECVTLPYRYQHLSPLVARIAGRW